MMYYVKSNRTRLMPGCDCVHLVMSGRSFFVSYNGTITILQFLINFHINVTDTYSTTVQFDSLIQMSRKEVNYLVNVESISCQKYQKYHLQSIIIIYLFLFS